MCAADSFFFFFCLFGWEGFFCITSNAPELFDLPNSDMFLHAIFYDFTVYIQYKTLDIDNKLVRFFYAFCCFVTYSLLNTS